MAKMQDESKKIADKTKEEILAAVVEMVTEALSSEETTVEAAITAVSGLSSYFVVR